MPDDSNVIDHRGFNPVRDGLAATGLYHSFELPDGRVLNGAMSLEWQRYRLASFGLPQDLRGMRVLDIGPWDGFYTFEMERRGAEVTAIDYVDLDTFRALHQVFESRAEYRQMDVYEMDPADLGTFDIVLCLGVLYHLKHPLLGLEKICAVTRGLCILDTFVIDGAVTTADRSPLPYLEFYERGELGGQLDNWCGPTVAAVEALARSAGFARTEVLRVTERAACVAAHRRWKSSPPGAQRPTTLHGLTCHVRPGRSFQSSKEEYIELWCAATSAESPSLAAVYPEVDGFGVPPLAAAVTADGLVVSVRVPPGLSAGRHAARIRIGDEGWSEPQTFYLDLPPLSGSLEITGVQDGVSWRPSEADWSSGGWVTIWVHGLSPEADRSNTIVEIAGVPHIPAAVFADGYQVNVRLRCVVEPGDHRVVVRHRGAASAPARLRILGEPPSVRGLELLG